MGKFLIIIGIIYFLYYAGMIIYDLFIKKEVVVNPDDTQVYVFKLNWTFTKRVSS